MKIDTMESDRLASLFTLILNGVKVRLLSFTRSYEELISEDVWEIVRVNSDGRVEVKCGAKRDTVGPAYLRREP